MKPPGPFRLGAGLLLFKGAVGLGLLGARGLFGDLDQARFQGVMARWPREGGPVFASHFATWDTAHYLYLSEVGYTQGVPSCAFYPLWPLLARWTASGLGGSHLVAGLVLSNVFSLTGWVLFYERLRRRWGASVAGWALVWLVAFPGSLFFQFHYTESLFFLLVMLLWWGLEDRRRGLAWAAALLLPLTRAVGVFAVLPIAWYAAWALLAAPVLGWGCYLALMAYWTGNSFEGFAAQKHWGVHSVGNLVNVPKCVLGFFSPTQWHEFTGSLLDRGVFVLVLYTLPVLWRLDKGLLVWTYWLGILPAMSGTFTSYTRFAACAFPVFLALAAFFNAPRAARNAERDAGSAEGGARNAEPTPSPLATGPSSLLPWLKGLLLAVLAAMHIVLMWRHVNFRWAG
jgi:hypothetical protein